MCRAPARAVRARFVRTCCTVVVQEHDLCATTLQCNAKRTLSSHFTLHSSHPALHASPLHFTFHSSSHLKSYDFFSPHLSSSHLIPSLLRCHLSKFFSTVFISSEHWQLISALLHASKLLLLKRSLRRKNIKCKSFCTEACDTDAFTQESWQHTLYYKVCAKHFPVLLCTTQLAQSTSQYYFVLHSLHKALPSTTLYYTACAKHFSILLCSTKLAQSAAQYDFALQSLRKALPSTTLYCEACTKHFPVLLCTAKLAQSTSRYSLLCTAKLAQSTSQYYFVLQSLHKALPSTTKLAQSNSQYYSVLLSLHKIRSIC